MSCCAWLLLAVLAHAVPAKSGQWKQLTLADGTVVRAELVGDEILHFWRAENGACYVRQGAHYAPVSKEVLVASAREARLQREQDRRQRLQRTRSIGGSHAPYVGQKRGLVILVAFNDLKFTTPSPRETIGQLLNAENYQEGDFYGSVRDYFHTQSGGVFELTFDVLGPVTLKNRYAYYGEDVDGERGNDSHAGEMVVDALKAVSDQVNFADYDWDGDYVVDQVFILYAGKGQADGGSTDTVWPHEWNLAAAYGSSPVFGTISVSTYACGAELNGKGNLSGIGTICHEFSHCLGLPDMYDTDYNGNYGMGTWDLMSSGSYNGSGYLPANYTAYEQSYIGWKTPIELTEDVTVEDMRPIQQGGEIYRISNDNYPNEYFLLENRQQEDWDAGLAGRGLLITHVDFDENVWKYNVVNSVGGWYMSGHDALQTTHQHCTVVHADGRANTSDEAGDPYPFNRKDSLSNTSSPSAILYHENADHTLLLNKALTGIHQNDDGTVGFTFRAVDNNTEINASGVVFEETFDQCDGLGGNDGVWSTGAGAGQFLPDNVGWDAVGEGGGAQCAKFGNFAKKGSAVSPTFTVAGTTRLTFNAAPWGDETTRITVLTGNSDVTIEQQTFNLVPGTWTRCETNLIGTGDVSLRFTPSSNRFFLDDIKAEVITTAIRTPAQPSANHHSADIYDLQGRHLGSEPKPLPHGVYIIGGKKVVK